jgi:quinol monooxygenase YgiN
MPYGLYTKFLTQPGKRDALRDLLLQAAKGVADLPACRLYVVNEDTAAEDALWVTEIWDDAAAHAASLQMPGAKELIAQAMPLMAGRPEQVKLHVSGGHGPVS